MNISEEVAAEDSQEFLVAAEDSPEFLSRSGATLTPGSVIWRPALSQAEFLKVWM